jgi:outer membrane protein OmpA-like peptidoglycan-associated protein
MMSARWRYVQQMKRMAVLAAAAVFGLSGCAADGGSPFGLVATEEWVRNYVREQNAPIQGRVAQLETRVTQVDGRVTQVAGQTAEARKIADDGVSRATAVDARLTQALAKRFDRALVESFSLQYASGQFALMPTHREILDRVRKMLAENPTYTVDIVGFTDSVGGSRDNVLLSWRREEHVRRYLVERDALLNRVYFIGLGEDLSKDDAKARAADRHVALMVFRPAQ